MTTAAARQTSRVTQDALRAWNAVYNAADNIIWQLGVYEAAHDGWQFTNIGGKTVLSFIGEYSRLTGNSVVVEIGCGLGDTCRYLVERFGCRVVGFDMNAAQISNAELTRQRCATPDKLQFVHGSIESPAGLDALASSNGSADLVYTLDVLMLVEDPGAAIRSAASLLRKGGRLAIAEVTAGPSMPPSLPARLWEMDGMASMLTPAEYGCLIKEAGLSEVRFVDRTPLAVGCFSKIDAALKQHRSQMIEGASLQQYQGWCEVTALYLEWFRTGQLLYSQIIGA